VTAPAAVQRQFSFDEGLMLDENKMKKKKKKKKPAVQLQ
jgi:hypothetical protein